MRPRTFLAALAPRLAGAGALTALLALGLAERAPPPPPVAPLALPAPPAEAAPGEDRSEAWLATILARPLFDPRRRPGDAVAAGAPAASGLPRLTGVLVGGFGASAIFETRAGGKPLVVQAGDQVEAYLVQSILPGEATLLGPDGRHVLRPAYRSGGGTPSAATAKAEPEMVWDTGRPRRGS